MMWIMRKSDTPKNPSFPRRRESSGLFNMPFDFVLAAQGIFILLDSRLRGNDGQRN
jgi:hypothetical protein